MIDLNKNSYSIFYFLNEFPRTRRSDEIGDFHCIMDIVTDMSFLRNERPESFFSTDMPFRWNGLFSLNNWYGYRHAVATEHTAWIFFYRQAGPIERMIFIE